MYEYKNVISIGIGVKIGIYSSVRSPPCSGTAATDR